MQYLIMHKNDPKTEAGELPSMELIQQMGAFVGEFVKQGRFIDGAGLSGSRTRTRLTFRNGVATVKNGPYVGERELPAATTLIKVSTRDEALAWAERYGRALGDGEIEIGKVNEPWDIGVMPAPKNPPLQVLLIEKADATTEAGGRTAAQKTALAALKSEMKAAGVLVGSRRLRSSATAKRLTFTKNALRILDGPFAESKELIGGFAVMELDSMDDAIALCRTYADILGGTLEIDIRQVDPEE